MDGEILKDMGQAIAHRGPDAEGFWADSGIGLVHRRLSIIDLAGGDQPLGNEDDSIQVVFNGEIYNFQELRAHLEDRGHRFRTRSDTEVLVHLYEEVGEQLVSQLRGMFAFALWDKNKRQLLLARDRLGIKPLYFYRDGEKLVFGSELKAILAHPGVGRTLDVQALEDFLAFGIVPGPRSIFLNMEKLLPGHILTVPVGGWGQAPRRYWQLHLDPDFRPSATEWQEAIRAKMAETVRLHRIADVPVGAFLSGGLDSSIVVASQVQANAVTLQTFSMGFGEEQFNELPYARQVAHQYGTQHAEEVVTPDAVGLLDALTYFFDEPFADPSAIPTFLVSQLAARSVKVVLSGDGGDEAFGGYTRYAHDLKEAAVRRWLPGWFRRGTLGPLAQIWPKADWLPRPLRARTTLTNLALDAGEAYANTLTLCRSPLRRTLLAADVAGQLNGHDPGLHIRQCHAAVTPADPLGSMIAVDVETVLPDDFLVKVDRASMAHGLEVRPPFLDHEFMELAARVPSHFKIRSGETKWILKAAYANRLPPTVVQRRKQGFDIPLDSWLRGPLRDRFESTVLDGQAPVSTLVNQVAIRRLYRNHCSGLGRHGQVLWALLVLAHWAERYLPSFKVQLNAMALS